MQETAWLKAQPHQRASGPEHIPNRYSSPANG